jgi:hypothetical protein
MYYEITDCAGRHVSYVRDDESSPAMIMERAGYGAIAWNGSRFEYTAKPDYAGYSIKEVPAPVVTKKPKVRKQLVVTITLYDADNAPVCFGSEGLADLLYGIGSGSVSGSYDVVERPA